MCGNMGYRCLEKILFYILVLRILSYVWIRFACCQPRYRLDIDTVSSYFSAMERATDICPRQRMCGGFVDVYDDYPNISDVYMEHLERQANIQSSDENPCCVPCSCEVECMIKQNCCPDTNPWLFNDTLSPISIEMVRLGAVSCTHMTMIISNTPDQKFVDDGKIPDLHFYAVSECPRRAPYHLGYNCSFSIFNVGPLDTYVVLEDVDNRFLYRNKYCAQCHNATGLQP